MKTPSQVKWLAYIVSLAGLVSEITPLTYKFSLDVVEILTPILSALKTMNMMLPRSFDMAFYLGPNKTLATNFYNLFFHAVLLVGAIGYHRSAGREIRLLRLCFSLLVLGSCLYILNTVLIFFKYRDVLFSAENAWMISLFNAGRIAVVGALCWRSITYLTATRQPKADPAHEFVKASRWYRAFHHGFDIVLCILVFTPMFFWIPQQYLSSLEMQYGASFVFLLMLVTCRLLYYLFFETGLGSTPAKYFTETRILSVADEPLTRAKGAARTLCRLVPFEPFSFLSESGGWHDRWTNTQVVEEQTEGRSLGYYFLWSIAIAIVLPVTGFFADHFYDQYRNHLSGKSGHAKKIAAIHAEMKHLSESHFIKLVSRESEYNIHTRYLKIEKIEGDIVTASIVTVEDYADLRDVAGYYFANRDTLKTMIVSLKVLQQAYTPDYSKHIDGEGRTIKIANEQEKYEVDELIPYQAPLIQRMGNLYQDNQYMSMAVTNCGWSGELIEIRNIKGDIQWSTALPAHIVGLEETQMDCYEFGIRGSNADTGKAYRFEITVRDQRGVNRKYRIEGIGYDQEITRVE